MNRKEIIWLLATIWLVSSMAYGRHEQPTSQPQEDAQACKPLMERETLTDSWLGLGRELSEKGVDVRLWLTQTYQQNARGGLSTHRRAGRYMGRYDLEIEVDLEKLANLRGGKLFALARGGWSNGIDAPSVGSLFGVNGLSVSDREIDLWELYYEQDWFNKKLFTRLGKIDLTGGFECRGCPGSFDGNTFANDESIQFLNNSLINNPTIPFPQPGLAALMHAEPVNWLYLSAAVADAQADVRETGFNTTFHGQDDFFSIYEIGLLPHLTSTKGPLQGAYRVGTWYDPQGKDRFDGSGVKRDDVGFYTSCDQMVWKENDTADDSQGLGIFGRYGIADAAVNEIKSFWSIGPQYQGLISGRDKDILGLGVGQGRLSRQAGFTESNETVLECYYNIEIAPWLHISPDIQYIFNPGGDDSVDNAIAVGARVKMAF